MPRLEQAASEAERAEWVTFWRQALAVALARPRASDGRNDHLYPTDVERWVLDAVAVLVVQLRDDEQPSSFVQAVLDLPAEADDWAEVFARALHRYALSRAEPPKTYPLIVRGVVQRALADGAERRRWSLFERVWDALVGIDGFTMEMWEPRHQELVKSLADVFEAWMTRAPMYGRRLATFAQWLARPAAVSLRVRSLPWFSARLVVSADLAIRDTEDAADALAALLDVVWREDEVQVRSIPAAFTAFQSLLRWLGDNQNARGLDLLGRLGKLS
jgi:hypothetical protein